MRRESIDAQWLPAAAAFAALYALVAAPLAWQHGVSASAMVQSAILGALLAALSAIDLRHYRLPDVLTFPLAAAGLLVAAWSSEAPLWWHVASALIGFGLLAGVALVYRRLRGREGLGLGDAKLFAASGAWLGAEALPGVLLWACGAAILGLLIAAWSSRELSRLTRIPFGPFLAFGTWMSWLYAVA